MTHELKTIVQQYEKRQEQSAVLATVVALDGSSYRRPGVRMLIFENGNMVGAVSGGCVEKEMLKQASSVFLSNISKIMVYDGRYRLGCEGVLYILLEAFKPDKALLTQFWETVDIRKPFYIESFYKKEHSENRDYHSVFNLNNTPFYINKEAPKNGFNELVNFKQEMHPCFRLIIIGGEHDAVQLCKYASMTGWEVTVVVNPREEKTKNDFPGIKTLLSVEPESFQPILDEQTAVLVMTHSFAKDLQFLITLKEKKGAYIGLLGPQKRREKLFNELLERYPDITEGYMEQIHGPAGIDIGAETPQEIAISVISEILTVVNKKEPLLLKDKVGKIHV